VCEVCVRGVCVYVCEREREREREREKEKAGEKEKEKRESEGGLERESERQRERERERPSSSMYLLFFWRMKRSKNLKRILSIVKNWRVVSHICMRQVTRR